MKNIILLIITVVTLACFPNVNFGQAPTLGTTSGFALFTAVGAFDNIGAATSVIGDVGTNVGAFSAFPPGTLVGQKHVADPASVQAATDVATAYSDLSGVTCGPVIGVTLGNNQVLTPNVYCIGAASTLNGDLILDGQGDPNALFIIKINGALATSTHSHVIMTGSASFCNVYWQINGAFSLGDSSVFRGTIVANGAISLLEGSTLLGRGLSTAGAIDLHNNLVAVGMQPIVTVVPGSNTIFCSGGSVNLTATVTTGSIGPFSYLWSPGGQTTSSITVSPTITTTYTVAVTALNGCSAGNDNIVVTVHPALTINLGNDTTVALCVGYLTLNAGVSGSIYSWNTGATTQTINVSTTGTYSVIVTNSGGCTGSDAINVVVNGILHLNLGPDTIACNCIVLNAYVSGGTSYHWCGGQNYPTLNVCSTGVYCVTVSNGVCVVSDTIHVTVNQPPVVNLGNDTTAILCAGYLTLNAGNSGSGYSWSTGATTQTIHVSTTGTYSVIVTNSGGCTASDAINVTINGIIHLDLGSDTTVCGCILLNAYVSGGTSYHWCGGQNYPTLNVCATGVYCVTVSNGVCTAYDTIHIIVNQPAVVHLGSDTTVATSIILNAGNAGASFLWNTGATTQMITVTSSGQYIVIVMAANGCTDSDTINVSVINGIAENRNADFHVNVYPNPSNSGSFTLTFDIAERGNVEIKILNILGLAIYSEKLENFKGEYRKKITLENSVSGIYFADILRGDKRSAIKITIK